MLSPNKLEDTPPTEPGRGPAVEPGRVLSLKLEDTPPIEPGREPDVSSPKYPDPDKRKTFLLKWLRYLANVVIELLHQCVEGIPECSEDIEQVLDHSSYPNSALDPPAPSDPHGASLNSDDERPQLNSNRTKNLSLGELLLQDPSTDRMLNHLTRDEQCILWHQQLGHLHLRLAVWPTSMPRTHRRIPLILRWMHVLIVVKKRFNKPSGDCLTASMQLKFTRTFLSTLVLFFTMSFWT